MANQRLFYPDLGGGGGGVHPRQVFSAAIRCGGAHARPEGELSEGDTEQLGFVWQNNWEQQ